MEEKKTKITLRFTEEQCKQLKSRAERNSMTVSDYIRGIIFDKQNCFTRTITEGSQESSQITSETLLKVNQELIRMEHDLERIHGVKKIYMEKLKERIDGIWHMLN